MSDTAVRKAWRGKRGRWSLRLSGSDGRALGSSCKHNCGVHVSLTVRDHLSTRAIQPRRVRYLAKKKRNYFPGTSLKSVIDVCNVSHRTSKQASTALGGCHGLPSKSELIFTVTDSDTRPGKDLPLFSLENGRTGRRQGKINTTLHPRVSQQLLSRSARRCVISSFFIAATLNRANPMQFKRTCRNWPKRRLTALKIISSVSQMR